MFRNLFGAKADPEEKEVSEICEQIISNPPIEDLPKLYNSLEQYVPKYTEKMLSKISNNMVIVLGTITDSRAIQNSVIHLLLKMTNEYDSAIPGSNPVDILCAHPNFPGALFLLTYPLNRSINKILLFFFIKSPEVFFEYAISSPASLKPMIKATIETKDNEVGDLFHKIVVSNPDLLNTMVSYIKPVFKQFPLTTAIDFMIRTPSIFRPLIPDSEIEPWVLQNTTISLFDLQQIVTYFKFMWEKPIAAQLLIRTEANQKIQQLNWLKKMSPQTFTLSPEDAKQAADSLLNSPTPLQTITENYGKHETVVRNLFETFIFIRLFVLSLAKPSDVPEDAIKLILTFLFDAEEWISAAAIQLIIIWIVKYDFQIPSGYVYRVAASIFNSPKSKMFVSLSKALLMCFSFQYKYIVSILATEPDLFFSKQQDNLLLESANWRFPHLKQNLTYLDNLDLINFNDSLKTLGYVLEYLGIDSTQQNQTQDD